MAVSSKGCQVPHQHGEDLVNRVDHDGNYTLCPTRSGIVMINREKIIRFHKSGYAANLSSEGVSFQSE